MSGRPDAISRVLLIDDSAVQGLLLQRQLAGFNIETCIVRTLAEAHQAITQTGEGMEAVFVELLLQEENGFEVAGELINRYRIPCVLLSSSGNETDHQWAEKLGIASVLLRPVSPAAMKRTLASLSSARLLPQAS